MHLALALVNMDTSEQVFQRDLISIKIFGGIIRHPIHGTREQILVAAPGSMPQDLVMGPKGIWVRVGKTGRRKIFGNIILRPTAGHKRLIMVAILSGKQLGLPLEIKGTWVPEAVGERLRRTSGNTILTQIPGRRRLTSAELRDQKRCRLALATRDILEPEPAAV